MKMKKIYLGSDHAGFLAKEEVKKILDDLKVDYEDLGTYNMKTKVDYPIYAKKVAEKVSCDKENLGILICGSGTGMQIAANKTHGIRAAFAYDKYSAIMARKDNNANIVTLRARNFDHRRYKSIISNFLKTKFSNEPRHIKRIDLLE